LSHAQLGAPTTEPEHTRLKFALAGGGVYANGPSSAYAVNATVDTTGLAAAGNASQIAYEVWGGWNEGPAVQSGSGAMIALTSWPSTAGTEGRSNESRLVGVGIFLKGHSVAGVLGRHATIRITPRNQGFWVSQFPDRFLHLDKDGNPTPNVDRLGHFFLTLGAGPGTGHIRRDDSTLDCTAYNLTNATSFRTDVENAVEDLELLRYKPSDEDVLIYRLLSLDSNYEDRLTYCWDPYLGTSTFNSNSYVSGLLRASSLPAPSAISGLGRYLGWSKPVPPSEFNDH
jgi:hypothetical protein